MQLEFINLNSRHHPIPKQYLCRKMQAAWDMLLQKGFVSRQTACQLVLVWVRRERSQYLNRKYRKQNRATDVLSFQGFLTPTKPPPIEQGAQIKQGAKTKQRGDTLGELVLCAEVIKYKAGRNKLSFRDYALYCVLHGTLHLLGFEHESSPKKAQKMFRLQDEIFDFILAP